MRHKAAVAVLLLILAVATYASQRGDAASAAWPGIAIAILGSGTLAAVVTNTLNRRQLAASATNVDANTINTNAETIGNLSAQVSQLLAERAKRAEREEEMLRRIDELQEKVRDLEEEVERLRNAARPGRKTDTETEPTIVPPTPRMPISHRRRR